MMKRILSHLLQWVSNLKLNIYMDFLKEHFSLL